MRILTVDRDNYLNAEATLFANRRLLFALSRFSSSIESVVLKVEDANGPRGGIDKSCQLLIRLRRGQDVVISDKDESLHGCLARVADRAGRTVSRRLRRTQDLYRRRASLAFSDAAARL